ncbi:MAG: hypothetical protein OEZ10_13650 [Gammaproteobacteria bacterium]|nr:hypothetical protein [Gammaproteobacteria bacterium]
MAAAAILGVLGVLFGLIALIVGAFRAHIAWGVLFLLLAPIVAPIFCMRHWRLARGGLALIVVGLGAIVYSSYTEGYWPPHKYLVSLTKPENMGPTAKLLYSGITGKPSARGVPSAAADTKGSDATPAAQAIEAGKSVSEAGTQTPGAAEATAENKTIISPADSQPEPVTDTRESTTETRRPARSEPEPDKSYKEFSLEDLPAYFGFYVRITDIDNNVHEALLKDQEGSLLVLEKEFAAGGRVEFRLEQRNIVKIEALR